MSCHASPCLGGIVLLQVLETSFPTSGPLHIQFPLPKVFFSHPINLSSYYRATTHPLPQFLFFSLLLVFILLSRSYLVYLFTQLCPPSTLSCKLWRQEHMLIHCFLPRAGGDRIVLVFSRSIGHSAQTFLLCYFWGPPAPHAFPACHGETKHEHQRSTLRFLSQYKAFPVNILVLVWVAPNLDVETKTWTCLFGGLFGWWSQRT